MLKVIEDAVRRMVSGEYVSAFEKVNKKEQMAGLEPTSSIINPQYQSSRHHG